MRGGSATLFSILHTHSPPLATGRTGSLTQPLHDGAYSREPCSPACSIASRLWQAVTPEPHMCTTCDGALEPSTVANSSRNCAADLKRPSLSRLSANGRFN